ncbi:protein kinase C delta type-like [Engystomops pustulosus]|uniref:protein kinase C delta type-like n=1 Tax=Engystomops pustulosus TaxID=76066 RepID=UPI003AFAD788
MGSSKKFKEDPNGGKKRSREALSSSEPPKKKPCPEREQGKEAEKALKNRKRPVSPFTGPSQKRMRCGSKAEEEKEPKPGPSKVTPPDSGATMNTKRYTGKEVIGQGSFGQVVKVWDVIKKRHIAIKTVPRGKSSSAEMSLRTEQEVLEIAIGNPFLIHSHLSFATKKLWYFAMEFASGGDLLTHLKNSGRLPKSSVQFYAAEITTGIQFLHGKGYIHRDIKPSNILIASSGHVKLADFGLAVKKTQDICGKAGTPRYVAPEVLRGGAYNLAADWYSFGVVLFQLATGLPSSRCIPSAFPSKGLHRDTANIIKELLDDNPNTRLGLNGCIRSHPFFKGINWEDLEQLRIPPPYIPGESKS